MVTEVWGREGNRRFVKLLETLKDENFPKDLIISKLRCHSVSFSVDDRKQLLLIPVSQRVISTE